MAISANSYGDTGEIGALVPRWSGTGGDFASTDRPTLASVESWVDQVSGVLNSVLAQHGFDIPISQTSAKLMLDLFVNEEVAAIIEGVNGSGRFGPTTKKSGGRGRFALILEDVEEFISANAVGIERLGAARAYDPIAGLSYRNIDERGNSTAPIFQRSGFGNSFTNWDSD